LVASSVCSVRLALYAMTCILRMIAAAFHSTEKRRNKGRATETDIESAAKTLQDNHMDMNRV